MKRNNIKFYINKNVRKLMFKKSKFKIWLIKLMNYKKKIMSFSKWLKILKLIFEIMNLCYIKKKNK